MKKSQERDDDQDTGDPGESDQNGSDIPPSRILDGFKSYLKGKGMPSVARQLGIGQAQFRRQLREEFKNGAITIKMPRNSILEAKLRKSWDKVSFYVLNVEDSMFFEGAAEVFFTEMRSALNDHDAKNPFGIGVVSGRTTGGMIESIVNPLKPWQTLISVGMLPEIVELYALNVSQTAGYDELRGNANVLAYEMARKILKELGEAGDIRKRRVEAFGLSAGLLQTKEEVRRTDCSPETSAVLKFTDPQRLAESLKALNLPGEGNLPKESQLDVVITGVGSINDSLFGRYSKDNKIDTDRLQSDGVVGDIAYCPVTRVGDLRTLRNNDGKEVEFYRAVSLEVLKRMSETRGKKVIVVARNAPRSSKILPIHAAVSARLCNVLITDAQTARQLHHALGDLE